MYTVSIGCLQPQGWLALFRVFRLGAQALRAAQAAPGCVHAQIFRSGKRYFAFSVWQTPVHMKAYATTGVHGQMMRGGLGFLKDFAFMAYPSDHIPSREAASRHLLETKGLMQG